MTKKGEWSHLAICHFFFTLLGKKEQQQQQQDPRITTLEGFLKGEVSLCDSPGWNCRKSE